MQTFNVKQQGVTPQADNLKGVPFEEVKNRGFQLVRPATTNFLVHAYREQLFTTTTGEEKGQDQPPIHGG